LRTRGAWLTVQNVERVEAVIGRRNELAEVERFLAGLADGPAAVTISGPPGVGKSTVWLAGTALAEGAGCRVLAARPTGAEASLSFAALADLLAPVEDAVLAELPAPQQRALDVALLRDEAHGPVDSRAVATALWNVLRSLAAEQPILIAVDDAQWLDEATFAALRFALRRLGREPVGALVTVRGSTEFEPLPGTELVLAPLSAAAMHDVIRERVGLALGRPTVVRIVQRSAGNAYYALEIARELARRGTDAGEELPLPPRLETLTVARLARLPAATRDALLLAAALAVPSTALVAAADLEPAEDEGLVRIDLDGRIWFEHPLAAAAVYESSTPARRRRVHRLIAGRIEDKEERARHLALAAHGADETVAAELDEAAADAGARGAPAAAAELGRLALAQTPRDATAARVRRSLTLARRLVDLGDVPAARAVLEACDRAVVEGELRVELLLELGTVLWYERELDRGYGLLREALDDARDPAVIARIHRGAAWLSQEVDLERAIPHADAAVQLLDPDQSPGGYSWSLLHGAYLRLLAGHGADEAAFLRGRELQLRGVAHEDSSPVLGMWQIFHDDFAGARALYERGLAATQAEGDQMSVLGTLLRLAELACWTGNLADAERYAAEATELAACLGTAAFLGGALYVRGLVDAQLGRVDEARAAGVRIVELFGHETQGLLGEWILGFVALSVGDPAGADEHLSRAADRLAALGYREPARFRFQPDHIEAVVQLGDLERAQMLLDALEERGRVFPRPWALATAARCRALLLAARGETAAASEAVDEALEHHIRLDMPFERARTLLVQGTLFRRRRQKRRSREALEEAAAIFEHVGARLWVAKAREELRRVAARRAPVELSETERRIATLAAAGLSNPEIAAQVFVSRKTVEANLARAYRKLGISSRAQLGRALDRESGAIS
jgi:DNA-binding NarL/FixJ family response regulator